jgi:hypothetical protein
VRACVHERACAHLRAHMLACVCMLVLARACACLSTCVHKYECACVCMRVCVAYVCSSVHEDGRFCCMPEGTATAAALTGVDWAAAAAEYLGSEGPKSHVASFPTRPTPFIQKMHRP